VRRQRGSRGPWKRKKRTRRKEGLFRKQMALMEVSEDLLTVP
jgi:hypothetical protein